MVLYTMSGGAENGSTALVTIDSPKLLFTLDPVFALLEFFTSAFPPGPTVEEEEEEEPGHVTRVTTAKPEKEIPETPAQPGTFGFRVDLHDVSVTLLESDTDLNTQVIQLYIQQVMMSQQV